MTFARSSIARAFKRPANGGDAEEHLRHERHRTSTVVRCGGLRIERFYEADHANRKSLKWRHTVLAWYRAPMPRAKLRRGP